MKIEMNMDGLMSPQHPKDHENTTQLLHKSTATILSVIATILAAGLVPFAFFVNLMNDIFTAAEFNVPFSYFLLFISVGTVVTLVSVTLGVIALITHKKDKETHSVVAPILSILSFVLCGLALWGGIAALLL